MMLAVTIAAAVLIGVSLGMLGGGGSILTVPILVYLAGMAPKEAIATSLFVVAVTSAVGVVPHARAGRVRWRTGALFGAAGMAGAYAGGRLAQYIPGDWLLLGFGLMMAVTAVAMLRGRHTTAGRPVPHELPVGRVLADGAAVGLVTGLVGAGGGFLVVPALALLGGLPMPAAVGTSLVVIAMKSSAGLLGYLHSVQLDWPVALAVTGAAVVGSILGSRLVGRVHPDTLRKAFGWFVIIMAGFVLLQQGPSEARLWLFTTATGWAAIAVITATTIAAELLRRRTRHIRQAALPRTSAPDRRGHLVLPSAAPVDEGFPIDRRTGGG